MAELEEQLGYRFGNALLLRQALTHRSYGTPNNERLEFLGDSVLNCAVARLLFDRFPGLPEGELSRVRASLVNQQSLFEIASDLGLGRHLLLGEGELRSGGARRPSILADALEGVLGAVMLDGGFQRAEEVVRRLFTPLVEGTDPASMAKDPKTRLQELLQGRRLALPGYTVDEVSGEAHEQVFMVSCLIPELGIRARGEGPSRRAAEQSAARLAYEQAVKK
jgi:ribonuclease III